MGISSTIGLNVVSVVIGTEGRIGSNLQQCFLDKGHSVIGVACKSVEDGLVVFSAHRYGSSEYGDELCVDGDSTELFKGLEFAVSGERLSNVVFCQEQNNDVAVLHDSVENWKKYSYVNVEVPLGIIGALGSLVVPSTRMLFLSRPQDFLPIANNGFYAASKTAIAYLMHALRLENPGFSVSSATIEGGDGFGAKESLESEAMHGTNEFDLTVASEVVEMMCSRSKDFMENELVFPINS